MPKSNDPAASAAVIQLNPNNPKLTTAEISAVAEIRRQLETAHALVDAAMISLASRIDDFERRTEYRLLDLATEELSDLEYIGRLEEFVAGASS